MPLRARTESGSLQPIDPTLEDHGSYVEPANAQVETRLPNDLASGIKLQGLGIEVRPAGSSAAHDGRELGGNDYFYPGVDQDTDFIAAPTPLGVETYYLLRSQQSPEAQVIHLSLPQGADLQSADGGLGAVITDGERTIAHVDPPAAFDADGIPVPVTMTVQGDSLKLTADFHGGDYREPVIVDPTIEAESYDYRSSSQQCSEQPTGGVAYWHWESPTPTAFSGSCSLYGMINSSYANRSYAANQYSQWLWTAPPATFIEQVDWIDTYNYWGGTGGGSCTLSGIYDPHQQPGQPPGGIIGAWENDARRPNCGYTGPTTFSDNVGLNADLNTSDPQGHNGNLAVWQLYFPVTGYHTVADFNDFKAANVYLSDRNLPQITTQPTSSSWADQPPEHDFSAAVGAGDIGLGIKYFWLLSPDPAHPTQLLVQPTTRSCSGVRGSGACSAGGGAWNTSLAYKLPEGLNGVSSIAFDQALNAAGTPSWYVPIDRSGPSVDAPSGSLYGQRANIDSNEPYSLNVSATDGAPPGSSPELLRSGVKRLEVYVDDETEPWLESARSCTGSYGSCDWSMSHQWDVAQGQFADGAHTIHIRAYDALDHLNPDLSRDFQITVHSDDSEPDVELTPNAPDSSGNFTVDVLATDGFPANDPDPDHEYGSGVQSLTAYVDGEQYGEPIVAAPGSCPNGGCSLPGTFTFGPDADLASHSLTVEAQTFAQQTGFETLGAQNKSFTYFGFNDLAPGSHEGNDTNTCTDAGNNVHAQERCAFFRYAELAGGRVFRFQVNYTGVDLREDSYQRLTAAFTAARDLQSEGFDVQLMPFVNGQTPPTTNQELLAYHDFVKYIADNYAASGHLFAIETWNEPNLQLFWPHYPNPDNTGLWIPPTPQEVANITDAGYQGVKDAYAQAQADGSTAGQVRVVPGAMSPIGYRPNTPQDGSLQGGAGKHFISGVYLHQQYLNQLSLMDPYQGDPATGPVGASSLHLYADNTCNINKVDDIFEQYVDRTAQDTMRYFPNAPSWVTEIGFPSDNGQDEQSADASAMSARGVAAVDESSKKAKECRYPRIKTIRSQASRLSHEFVNLRAHTPIKMFLVDTLFNEEEDGMHNGGATEYGIWQSHNAPTPVRDRPKQKPMNTAYCRLKKLQMDALRSPALPPDFSPCTP